jgi:hypothetical protein
MEYKFLPIFLEQADVSSNPVMLVYDEAIVGVPDVKLRSNIPHSSSFYATILHIVEPLFFLFFLLFLAAHVDLCMPSICNYRGIQRSFCFFFVCKVALQHPATSTGRENRKRTPAPVWLVLRFQPRVFFLSAILELMRP